MRFYSNKEEWKDNIQATELYKLWFKLKLECQLNENNEPKKSSGNIKDKTETREVAEKHSEKNITESQGRNWQELAGKNGTEIPNRKIPTQLNPKLLKPNKLQVLVHDGSSLTVFTIKLHNHNTNSFQKNIDIACHS